MSVLPLAPPERVLSRVRGYLRVRALVVVVLWGGTGLALVLAVAWLMAGGDGWDRGTPAPLLLDLLAGGAGAGTLAALWHWWAHRLGERRLTREVERAAGLREGEFLGAVELARGTPGGTSAGLARLARLDVSVRLAGVAPEELAGAPGRVLRRWGQAGTAAAGVAATLVALAAGSAPERARAAWSGLLSPLRALAIPADGAIEVEPGDAEVPRGASVTVTVRAPGREWATLRWQEAGEVVRVRVLELAAGRAGFTFDSVTASVAYRVTTPDGAGTRTYRITPVDPLFLAEVSVEVLYPAYTGRLADQFVGEIPPLEIPAGTRLRIAGRASREMASAALRAPGGALAYTFRVDGSRFRGEWTPAASGRYRWQLVERSGAGAQPEPQPLEVRLVEDEAPFVAILFPGRDTVMPLSLRQPLVIEGRDDYGVARIELVSWRVSSFGDRGEPATEVFATDGEPGVLLRPVLDANPRRLLPGDTVRYYARVVEVGPEAKTARTREFALRLPGLAELRWEAQREMDELVAGVQELSARFEAVQRETSQLARRAATAANAASRPDGAGLERGTTTDARRPLDYRQSEDVRGAVERQERLLVRLDSVRVEAAKLARALEEAGLTDPELRGRLAELRQLMEEVVSPQLRRKLQEVADALAHLAPERVREALEALAREQGALRKKVADALDLLRRAALEERLRAAQQEAAELARQERALADEMARERELLRRAEQQRTLEARAAKLEEALRELDQRLAQAGEEAARPAGKHAAEMTAQAQRSMSAASQAARTGDGERAARSGRAAANLLEEAAQTLKQLHGEMTAGWRQAVQAALDRTAADALALARAQASILQAMTRGQGPLGGQEAQGGQGRRTAPAPGGGAPDGRADLQEFRRAEAAVLQGVRAMAQNLAEASRRSALVDRSLGTALGQTMQALEQAMEAMAGDAGPPRVPRGEAQAALAALNEVALRALASGAQVGQAQSGTGVEEALEQLAQLAVQQGAVYRESGALAPLQLGVGALARQLEELAALQEAIARGLAELAERPESAGDLLGDLGAMAREAEELADRLRRGDLSRETMERQGRLFHRLLDAGRTLEQDEWSSERESRPAGAYEPRRAAPLDGRAVGALRYGLPDASELRRLSPAHRQMVLEYFERLNRMWPQP